MDIVSLIAQSGGTLGLALFAIWMLNRVWEARVQEERRHSEMITEMWRETKDSLDRNTVVIARLLDRMDDE